MQIIRFGTYVLWLRMYFKSYRECFLLNQGGYKRKTIKLKLCNRGIDVNNKFVHKIQSDFILRVCNFQCQSKEIR